MRWRKDGHKMIMQLPGDQRYEGMIVTLVRDKVTGAGGDRCRVAFLVLNNGSGGQVAVEW